MAHPELCLCGKWIPCKHKGWTTSKGCLLPLCPSQGAARGIWLVGGCCGNTHVGPLVELRNATFLDNDSQNLPAREIMASAQQSDPNLGILTVTIRIGVEGLLLVFIDKVEKYLKWTLQRRSCWRRPRFSLTHPCPSFF